MANIGQLKQEKVAALTAIQETSQKNAEGFGASYTATEAYNRANAALVEAARALLEATVVYEASARAVVAPLNGVETEEIPGRSDIEPGTENVLMNEDFKAVRRGCDAQTDIGKEAKEETLNQIGSLDELSREMTVIRSVANNAIQLYEEGNVDAGLLQDAAGVALQTTVDAESTIANIDSMY